MRLPVQPLGAGVVAGVVDGAVVVVVVVVVFEEELPDCELPVEEISVSGAVVVCGVVDEGAGVVAEGVVGCVTFSVVTTMGVVTTEKSGVTL